VGRRRARIRPVASEANRREIALSRVLVCLGIVLFLGLLLKLPCTSGSWADGRPYTRFCYTDIVPLFRSEGLAQRKFPYLQHPNEYPVGTGLVMWVSALPARAEGDFFGVNVVVLSAAAVVVTILLFELVGSRALFFAAAPTLLLNAFLNWDLVPVLLMTAGTVAFLRQRDGRSGALLGAGAATKIFPGLVAVPFVLDRLRTRGLRQALRLAIATIFLAVAINLPFMILTWHNWTLFFRFNSRRVMDWATVWFLGCHTATGRLDCGHPALFSAASVAAFVAGSVLVWGLKARWEPNFARWTFAFPVLVIFLLTAKVYSPQYSLWLLPWFALVLPDVRLFMAFELADVAVYFTEFSWLARHTGFGGLSVGWVEVAVLARVTVLMACLVAYVRRAGSGAGVGAAGPQSPYAQLRTAAT
jgi:uncharacterized membrane protein